ncbi:MAG: ADP-ribosylglycohydrolase family protein [Alkalispirochaeta sp.]
MKDRQTRRKEIILGALVADAASMGLHWIYSQPKIRRIAPEAPEFLEPDPSNYEGIPAYFAHDARHAGDFSMYGEGMLVVLRSVAETQTFDWQHYARAFQGHFGFGGEYVGYIDTPTRITLTNQIKQYEELLERATAVPFDGEEKEKKSVTSKVLGQFQILRGEDLREKVRDTIRQTKGGDAEQDLASRMISVLEETRTYPGADDVQLPALTKVPILVAAFPDDPDLDRTIEEAVRVTHNNDTAVAWALFFGRLLRWSLDDGASSEGFKTAIRDASAASPGDVRDAIDEMLRRTGEDNKTVTMKLGPACGLDSGVPVALHNLLGTDSYVDAVRRNIWACGDSCGRAVVVGSLAAVLFDGVPRDWIERLSRSDEVSALVEGLG